MITLQSDIQDILDSLCASSGPPIDEVLVLQATIAIELKRGGRRYSYIFFSRAASLIVRVGRMRDSILIPGGWNPSNLPDGTFLSLREGQSSLPIIHRISDQPFCSND
jgi:hypothetical protein